MSEHGEYSPPPEREAPPEVVDIGQNVTAIIDETGINIGLEGDGRHVSFRLSPSEAMRLGEFITMHSQNLTELVQRGERFPIRVDASAGGALPRVEVAEIRGGPDPIPVNRNVIREGTVETPREAPQ
jgi:hypothetical protein